MRIAFITTSGIPSMSANSIHVVKMCHALQQEGHDVTVWCPDWQASTGITPDLRRHYGVDLQAEFRRLPWSRRLRGHNFFLGAALQARLSRPDLVYVLTAAAGAWTSQLGVPTIFESHDIPSGVLGPTYFRLMLQGRGFMRLVVISEVLKRLLTSRFPNELGRGNIIVAPDGVDLERFEDLPDPEQARNRLGLGSNQFAVGYAGHLYPGRGIDLIIALAASLPDVLFLMMGGTPDAVRQRMEEVDRLSLQNLRFFGFVPNADLALYQAACDVLLMPYQRKVAVSSGKGDSSAWMSPMKMFEYMATGRLIISSDLPVLREILSEKNSVLCDPEDVSAWKSAIERARDDHHWREQLGSQARFDVQEYTWRRRVQRMFA